MPISYTCQNCGKEHHMIASRFQGMKVRCSCGHQSRLPGEPKSKKPAKVERAIPVPRKNVRPVDPDKPLINDDFSDLDALLEGD